MRNIYSLLRCLPGTQAHTSRMLILISPFPDTDHCHSWRELLPCDYGNSFKKEEVLMVTTRSYDSPITLLSETDELGKITFVNDTFCRISKYHRDELVGKPHNIVRHPDMPRELFQSLWNTIQRGEIFKCVLKNRARDGSHYWVNATIMAVQNQDNRFGKCIGVRHLIPDEMTAQKLFEAQAASLGLAGGLRRS